MKTLRTTAVIVFCAYIGFVVAGLAFGKMVEYDDFAELLGTSTGVAVSYWTLYAGALAALLAVLVGGLPLAFAAARYAIATKHWRLLALCGVPPVSLAVWIGYIFLVEALNPHPVPILARPLPVRIVGVGLFGGLFALAAIASTAAISIVVIRSQIREELFRFAHVPEILTTLAMAVTSVAVLVYGLAAKAANPQLFTEDNGLLASNTTISWIVILAMMTLATAVAVAALIRSSWSDSAVAHAPASAGRPAS